MKPMSPTLSDRNSFQKKNLFFSNYKYLLMFNYDSEQEQTSSYSFKIKSLEDGEHIILIRQDDNSLKIIFTTPGTGSGHSITIYGDDIPSHLKTFGLTTSQKLAKAILTNQAQIRTKGEQISLKFMHARQWQHLNLEDAVNLEVEELVEIVQFYYQLSKKPQRPSFAHSRSSRLLPIEE